MAEDRKKNQGGQKAPARQGNQSGQHTEAVKVNNRADNKAAGPANVAAKTAKAISVRRGEFGSLISRSPRLHYQKLNFRNHRVVDDD